MTIGDSRFSGGNSSGTGTDWLEVSLTVNGELAEAVADVLARFAPNGITTEQAVSFTTDEDEGTPVGPITVRAYLPINEKLEETRSQLEEALYFLGMIQPLPSAAFNTIADRNWMEAWKEHYKPIPVGKSLLILPAWLESTMKDRIPIKIDPGMAFGTGTHPTTQLCLGLVEDYFINMEENEDQEGTVIDVGCGSGILSIAAVKLGARSALGVDVDEKSVTASCQNAIRNGVVNKTRFELGSVKEIEAGDFTIREASVVLANILAPVIIQLFKDGLADLVKADGVLILSGILAGQADLVLQAARERGLALPDLRQTGDWVAMSFTKGRG